MEKTKIEEKDKKESKTTTIKAAYDVDGRTLQKEPTVQLIYQSSTETSPQNHHEDPTAKRPTTNYQLNDMLSCAAPSVSSSYSTSTYGCDGFARFGFFFVAPLVPAPSPRRRLGTSPSAPPLPLRPPPAFRLPLRPPSGDSSPSASYSTRGVCTEGCAGNGNGYQ